MLDSSTKKAKSIRNAENRRQKSKVAARCRRRQETKIFSDLSTFLPILEGSKPHLDKVSIVRLTLCDLILKRIVKAAGFLLNATKSSVLESEFDSQVNQAMGGFILVFALDGDVIYASEGVMEQLGISKIELMGHSIFDFSHQYDHPEIRSMLMDTKKKGGDENDENNQRSCLFRMKCSVASTRGRNDAHHHCSNYKMVNCMGRMVQDADSGGRWFISICEPLLHPSDGAIPLNKTTFMTRHSPDMKFIQQDVGVDNDPLEDLFGYKGQELIGKSLFEFNHAADGEGIAKAFKFLTDKEQNQTEPYRFLTKGGGWVWLITQATLIHGSGCGGCTNKSPDYVVCIHWVSSGREEPGQILSLIQISGQEMEEIEPEVASPITSSAAAAGAITSLELLEKDMNEISELEDMGLNGIGSSEMSPDEENAIIADLLVEPYFLGIPPPKGQEGMMMMLEAPAAVQFTPLDDDDNDEEDEDDMLMKEVEDLTTLAPMALTTTTTPTTTNTSAGDAPLDVMMLQNLLASLDMDDILELGVAAGDTILGGGEEPSTSSTNTTSDESSDSGLSPPTPPPSVEDALVQDEGVELQDVPELITTTGGSPIVQSPIGGLNLVTPNMDCYVLSPGEELECPPPNKLNKLMGTLVVAPVGLPINPEVVEGGVGGVGGLFMLVPVGPVSGGGVGVVGGVVGGGESSEDSPNSSSGHSSSLDSAGQLELVNLVRAQQLQIQQQAEINRELLARIEFIEQEGGGGGGCGGGVRRNSIGKRNSARDLVNQPSPPQQQPALAPSPIQGQGGCQNQGSPTTGLMMMTPLVMAPLGGI